MSPLHPYKSIHPLRPVGFHPPVKDTAQTVETSSSPSQSAMRLMLRPRDSGHKFAWVIQGIVVTSHDVMWWVKSSTVAVLVGAK